jgi:type IV secretion system protein VirD4
MRRAALWSFGTAFVLIAAAIVWSLAYAAVTGFAFKTPALLSALTKTDPFLAYKHAVYYWPSAAVQRNALVAAGITAALFVAGWISLFVWRSPTPYGDARFARGGDLFRANLHSKEGLILGWHGSTLLRNDDPRHPLVVGPTRSGKGRGFVIPNLLAWQGSAIVLDIKHENFRETAGARRAAGDDVFMVAPGSARSHCYNPLDFVRRGPEKITDLTNVAHFLIPDPRHGEPIWSQKARDLFVGILGYVLESKEVPDDARTIRTALRLLSTGRDIGTVLKAIILAESESLSSFVVGRFNQIVAEPPDTRGSVLANLTTALAPWDNQLIAGVTSRSDFDIRLLRRRRMTIYIGPPPSDLESYRRLVRLLVQQIHDALMRELPGPEDRYDVLVMLDEFRQLQRMDAIVEKIPISAGYGFRMALIIQNLSQLDEIYGKATREGIVANCALKLFVSVDDLATANYVSDQLGNRTITTSTTSIRGTGFGHDRSVSKSLTGVPLMRADEVIRLSKTRSILMIANERPILTTKIRYDKDWLFRRLARAGQFAFRSVPDVPILEERPLVLLTQAYGSDRTVPSVTVEPVGEARDGKGPTPAQEAVRPTSTRDMPAPRERTIELETPSSTPFRPEPVQATRAEFVDGHTVDGSSADPDAAGFSAVAQQPSEPAAGRLPKSAKRERTAVTESGILTRPSGRERDSLLAAFGSETMSEIYSAVRMQAEGLSWIAERLEGDGYGRIGSDLGDAPAIARELRKCASASLVRYDGELEVVVSGDGAGASRALIGTL